MDKRKIQPCLRCGSERVEVVDWYFMDSRASYFRCECKNGHKWDEWLDTREEAIARWNDRPTSELCEYFIAPDFCGAKDGCR